MKKICTFLLSACLLTCGCVSASPFSDRDFNQDRMITTNYNQIIILSPFDDSDHITAYSDYGSFQWDVSVSTKVISMKMKDGFLYIFSKSRYVEKTYLTCVDADTGIVLWER